MLVLVFVLALVLVFVFGCAGGTAYAGTSVESGPVGRLSAAFVPNRLGAPTTVEFAVDIAPSPVSGLTPLGAVEVAYPSNVGLATSGLGVEACNLTALEMNGATACPPDSKMGQGSATVALPFGPYVVQEKVSIQLFAAPSDDGFVHLAILASGSEPVIAQAVLAGVVLPGRLRITIPLIESLPGAPYVSLVEMHASLGGQLTYYEQVRGHTVAYRPRGIALPDSCPRGGWNVIARFAFTDGNNSGATTVIPCPRRRR